MEVETTCDDFGVGTDTGPKDFHFGSVFSVLCSNFYRLIGTVPFLLASIDWLYASPVLGMFDFLKDGP